MYNINQLYQSVSTRNQEFSFFGTISPDIITSIFYIIRKKLEKKEISKQTKKKILNILIESLQNLYHHSRDIKYNSTDFDSSLINSSFLQFSPVKDGFQIMTANIIDEKHKHLISNKIDAVNKMNKEEIRFQYRDILNNGNFSEKGTAGLGFLDIARKSENKLEYKIEKINEEISFFILKIKIN